MPMPCSSRRCPNSAWDSTSLRATPDGNNLCRMWLTDAPSERAADGRRQTDKSKAPTALFCFFGRRLHAFQRSMPCSSHAAECVIFESVLWLVQVRSRYRERSGEPTSVIATEGTRRSHQSAATALLCAHTAPVLYCIVPARQIAGKCLRPRRERELEKDDDLDVSGLGAALLCRGLHRRASSAGSLSTASARPDLAYLVKARRSR